MTSAEALDIALQMLTHEVDTLKAEIERWKQTRLTDVGKPAIMRSDLEWADGFCEAIAKLEVFEQVVDALAPEEPNTATLSTVYEYAVKQVIDLARFPSRSSSHMSNWVHICRAAAWGQAAHELRSWAREWEKAVAREAQGSQTVGAADPSESGT